MIKMIVSDMDGSLLDEKNQLPPDFFSVLDQIEKKGIRFVVASGRSYYTLYDNFTPRSDDIYYIADNGTCVVENGEITYKNVMTREDIIRILDVGNKIPGIHMILCGAKSSYVLNDPWMLEMMELYYSKRMIVKDLSEVKDEIFKIGICGSVEAVQNAHPIFVSMFSKELSVVLSGSVWIDIMNRDASKGKALSRMQEQLGITPKETMAFGDFYNDIEMLQQAHYSFVMENANEDMKQHGKFVAKSNREYGVIQAIKEHILY